MPEAPLVGVLSVVEAPLVDVLSVVEALLVVVEACSVGRYVGTWFLFSRGVLAVVEAPLVGVLAVVEAVFRRGEQEAPTSEMGSLSSGQSTTLVPFADFILFK